NLEVLGDVIAGAVEHERRMRSRRDVAGDLDQVQRHDLGVGGRHDEGGRGAPLRADGAEEIGPLIALVARGSGARSALRPDPGQRALLADARFILEPDFKRLALGFVGKPLQNLGGEVFLNASWASSSASRWRGRTDKRR